MPSNRRFGYWFFAIFVVLAVWSGVKGAYATAFVLALLAVAFGLLARGAPERLAPLNRAWFRLGELLGRVVSPIVLGILFFVVVTPVGVIGRLFGRDPLRLRKKDAASYWVERTETTPAPESFRRQF